MAGNRKSSWFKWLVILLLVGGVIAGCVWYFQRDAGDKPEYQTTKVMRGDLTQVVTATGTLNPVTNVTVGSQVSGIILKLFADWNSPVKAGQIIAQLDPATFKANVLRSDSATGKLDFFLRFLGLDAVLLFVFMCFDRFMGEIN